MDMPPSLTALPGPGRATGRPRRWAGASLTVAVLALSGCTSDTADDQAATTSSSAGSSFADLRPPAAGELTGTAMGWSADPVPGVEQSVIGTWMERKSWDNLAQGQWLSDNPTYVDYVAGHPDGAADIGVPLVPHDSGDDLDGMLREAASGSRDATYRSLGAALAESSPATVYARIWWEMNLRPMADGIDRALFTAAWVHAVPLIREGFAGAARPGQVLRIVFSPNADGADYEDFYPGDDQVDLMALDAYGQRWGTDTPSGDELLTLLDQQLDRFTDFARAHGKPVAMAEWGNVADKEDGGDEQMQGRGDFPPYVALVLDWAAREDAEYLVYFNSPDGGVGQTLADTPETLSSLQQAWSSAAR
jgi:hypothetical protein